MTIGAVLGTLAGLVLLLFAAFIFGYFRGLNKEALRKAEEETAFGRKKEKIRADVYTKAEAKKTAISSGSGRNRFDAITNSLRGNKD
ncbi:MAG: hypothetical protein LBC99_06570 [Spirochaetota bacterium]|jgi:hypothetical protein|nr:hypothetical protein [Spirochaetota bacterium]